RLDISAADGAVRSVPLRAQTVADFYRTVMSLLDEMGVGVRIWPMPVEVPSPIRFDHDVVHRSYDRDAVGRCWTILAAVAPVLNEARCNFVGKCSPVHFFWGAVDLAVTRFSGRPAPPREGPAFMREAYSHEVISHGFWPGGGSGTAFGPGPINEPVFYAYCVPPPAGFETMRIEPAAATYSHEFGEFVLPYSAVREAADPEATLRAFIDSTYAGAATLAHWDRRALERTHV